MDWNLARTRRSDSDSEAWNADNCTRTYWQQGGAALLADLVEAIAEQLGQAGKPDLSRGCTQPAASQHTPTSMGSEQGRVTFDNL